MTNSKNNQNKVNTNQAREEKVKKLLNDDISSYVNIITYLYFFSDVINFNAKKELNDNIDEDKDDEDNINKDEDKNDKDKDVEDEDNEDEDKDDEDENNINEDKDELNNSIINFLEYDDIFIYSLILATDLNYIQNFFLQNILNNKNLIDILLTKNNLNVLIKTIYEVSYLFYYWYKNLSNDNVIKIEILNKCSTLSFDIRKIFFLLSRSGIDYEEFNFYYEKIENLLSLKPFTSNTFKNENIDDQVSLNSYIYDNIRNIFENYIKLISEFKQIVFKDFSKVLYNKNHNPHIALLYSFINLCKKLNIKFIEFPRRFLEYYFKGVLMFKNKKEIKDIALITCSYNGNKDKIFFKKKTKIFGGKDKDDNDIIFENIRDISIGKTKILTIRTISESIKIIDNNNPISEYRISEYLMYEVYKKNQFLYLFSKDKTFDKNFLQSNKKKLGYYIESSLFKISSGNRNICIEFFLNNFSLNYLINILNIINLEKNLEFDNFCKILENSIILKYSSDDKMIDIPNENINIRWNKNNNSLIFDINISQKMPKISELIDSHIEKNSSNFPVIEVLANNNLNLWSFLMFLNLQFYKIDINVNVKDCSDLILQNDVNIIESNLPFQIFGPFPEQGANIYIGNSEVFNKDLTSLKLNIEWENLPNIGFKQYYKSYEMNTKTSDFLVSISFLNNNKWEPIDEKNKQKNVLFEYTIDESGNELLKNITKIDINISKLKLNTIKNIDSDIKFLSSSTLSGFLRLKLISPEYGFGHKLYYKITSQSMLMKKNKVLKEFFEKELNDPFVPIAKKISLDYTYEKSFFTNDNKDKNFIIYKVSPFGYINADFIYSNIKNNENNNTYEKNTFNKNLNYSKICIELSDITLSTITLFIYIDESNILEKKNLKYSIGYIDNNEFIQFSNNDILINETEGFTKSGILKLKLKKINNISKNTYLQSDNKNTLWIEIRFFEDKKNIPTILNIYPNPIYVKRKSNNNSVFLGEMSLNKILDDEYSEMSISQPFQSFNGKKAENDIALYSRISTRLLGKDRCITISDYKNFILENFQEISDVIEVKDTINSKKRPGDINLMVVTNKNIVHHNSQEFINASSILLSNIKNKLKSKCSAFANINIINPYYEKIKVIAKIKFNENYDKDIYTKVLNNAICNYISPWMFNKDIKISIIKSISVFNLIKFIKSQKYVKTILDLHILKNDNDSIKYTRKYNDVVYQSYSNSMLYSARKHIINVDENTDKFINDINIENSVIEENFIVGLEKFSTNNEDISKHSELNETVEDNFVVFK